MKILVLTLWCLIPVGLLAYHYGPGREQMTLDATASVLGQAAAKADAGDLKAAIAGYEESLAKLPKDRVDEARRIRLELAKARMDAAELPKAREELAALADELAQDPNAHAKLLDETLATLASARFYMTYLLKLEGLPDSEWEPEIEAARFARHVVAGRTAAPSAWDSSAALFVVAETLIGELTRVMEVESAKRLAEMEGLR